MDRLSGAVSLGRGIRRHLYINDDAGRQPLRRRRPRGHLRGDGTRLGVGALLGPALAGISMDFLPHGLPIFTALATLAFTVYAATSRSAA